ncbi:MAG: sulfite exporter TauE/SafE family protein [Vicinamibacterales bacterium]
MSAVAVALGLVIGASLGLLGGGGSILTVPIFVYVLAFPAKEAIAMSLGVVGVTSAVGVIGHWRAGNVNLRTGAGFGAVAMIGTYVGTRLAAHVSGTTQLAIFGVVMMVAAAFMFGGRAPATLEVPGLRRAMALVVLEGFAVGLLTGIVGVGGGFLIVPALVLLAMPMRQAVGTSLLIIATNCAVGFYGYLGHVHFTWNSMALVTAGTLPGIAVGTYLHRFVSQAALRRGFAVFLLLVAAFILYQNLGAVLAGGSHRPA